MYNLCIKAVCTTLGCCVAAAAPTAGADVPFVVGSYSPLVGGPRSVTGLLNAGGPIDVVALEGVMSMGSLALGMGELPEEEGRIGMALRPFGAKGSVKGLRDMDSVVAAMCADGVVGFFTQLGQVDGEVCLGGCKRMCVYRSAVL